MIGILMFAAALAGQPSHEVLLDQADQVCGFALEKMMDDQAKNLSPDASYDLYRHRIEMSLLRVQPNQRELLRVLCRFYLRGYGSGLGAGIRMLEKAPKEQSAIAP